MAREGQVDEPVTRSRIRRAIGREAFIVRRKIADARSGQRWAAVRGGESTNADVPACPHEVFSHHSLIRRELAGIDMQLQENKATNLRIAVANIDGLVLQPGETFSLWRLVGRPTASKGYLAGLVLDEGTTSSGIGGGLCQLSNLLFWLFAHSDLKIIERHRHLFDVFPDVGRVVPFGAGATIAYNYVDLRARNDSPATYALDLAVDDTHLTGSLRRSRPDDRVFQVVERDHRFDQQPWGGYSRHNQIVRQVLRDDEVIDEQLLAINDALVMYSPMLGA